MGGLTPVHDLEIGDADIVPYAVYRPRNDRDAVVQQWKCIAKLLTGKCVIDFLVDRIMPLEIPHVVVKQISVEISVRSLIRG